MACERNLICNAALRRLSQESELLRAISCNHERPSPQSAVGVRKGLNNVLHALSRDELREHDEPLRQRCRPRIEPQDVRCHADLASAACQLRFNLPRAGDRVRRQHIRTPRCESLELIPERAPGRIFEVKSLGSHDSGLGPPQRKRDTHVHIRDETDDALRVDVPKDSRKQP